MNQMAFSNEELATFTRWLKSDLQAQSVVAVGKNH